MIFTFNSHSADGVKLLDAITAGDMEAIHKIYVDRLKYEKSMFSDYMKFYISHRNNAKAERQYVRNKYSWGDDAIKINQVNVGDIEHSSLYRLNMNPPKLPTANVFTLLINKSELTLDLLDKLEDAIRYLLDQGLSVNIFVTAAFRHYAVTPAYIYSSKVLYKLQELDKLVSSSKHGGWVKISEVDETENIRYDDSLDRGRARDISEYETVEDHPQNLLGPDDIIDLNERINDLCSDIKSAGLSPFEAFETIYYYAVKRFGYVEDAISSKFFDMAQLNKINRGVCTAVSQFIQACTFRLGMPGLKCDLMYLQMQNRDKDIISHVACKVMLNDPKYGIKGNYTSDPTADLKVVDILKHDSSDEDIATILSNRSSDGDAESATSDDNVRGAYQLFDIYNVEPAVSMAFSLIPTKLLRYYKSNVEIFAQEEVTPWGKIHTRYDTIKELKQHDILDRLIEESSGATPISSDHIVECLTNIDGILKELDFDNDFIPQTLDDTIFWSKVITYNLLLNHRPRLWVDDIRNSKFDNMIELNRNGNRDE